MPKMKWERVRQWDLVRDGMSDMELADERDARWFAREAELEEGREARRAGTTSSPAKPKAKPPTKAEPPTKAKSPTKAKPPAKAKPKPPAATATKATKAKPPIKNLELRAVAQQLGVTLAEAQKAMNVQNEAATGLGGLTKSEKVATAARRVGITPDELRLFRRALAGNADALRCRQRVASLIRIVGSATVTAPLSAPAGAMPQGSRPVASQSAPTRPPGQMQPQKAAPASQGPKPKKDGKTKASVPAPSAKHQAMVYVTTWGNSVHIFHDCHNTRGFRGRSEPDPHLYRVAVQDPSCRGRQVCGTCRNVTFANAKRVEDQLRRFHGKPFDKAEWQRQGWFRPKPSGKPINGPAATLI